MPLPLRCRALAALVALGALAGGLAGCGGESSGAQATTVRTELRDFDLHAFAANLEAGTVTFTMRNIGKIAHEMLVVRTDLDGLKLPMAATGDIVDESKLTIVAERRNVLPGESATLTATIEPGNYILLCNISAHYRQRMWQAIKAK